MSEQQKQKGQKSPKTPRQLEIERLAKIGRGKRTEQQDARLDQLKKEERRERFTRLAPKRVQNVIEACRRLKQCGNANSYEYSAEEAQKIISAVTEAVNDAALGFAERKEERKLFSL